MFGGTLFSLIEVGKVTPAALQPLRNEVAAESWPTWLPEPLRGSQRLEDPGTYDWFNSERAAPQ